LLVLLLLPPPPRLFSPPFCHFPCFFNAFFETFFPEELEEEELEEEEESGGETALAAVGFAHNFFLLFDALFLKSNVFGETHIVRKDMKEVIFVLVRILVVVEKERMLLEVRTTAARIWTLWGIRMSLFNW